MKKIILKRIRLYFRIRAHRYFNNWLDCVVYPEGSTLYNLGELSYRIGVFYSEIANSIKVD